MPVVAAVVVSAAVSAYSARKASKAQAQAAQDAGERSDRQFDISRQDQLDQLAQQREDQKPFMEAGKTSLAQLMTANAEDGEFNKQFERGTFQEDPGYQFRLQEGEAGINRAAAANGNQYSGATLKALARFQSGLASQEYGNWDARQNNAQSLFEGAKTNKFNRIAKLAGFGETANNAIGNASQQTTNNITSLGARNAELQGRYIQDAGEARASGYVATGNAVSGAIKNLYGGM